MKRAIAGLMFVHRYLGLVFCLIFVIWFASGIVMIYKRMPEYTAEERLARMPALDSAGFRITPAQALEAAGFGEAPRRVVLTSFQGRPVYRFFVDFGSSTVYADDGRFVDVVDRE